MTPSPLTRSFRVLALTLLLGIGVPAQATNPEPQDDTELRANAELHLMAGELAAGRKQFDIAARELLLALRTLDDKDLASRATTYALGAGDAPLALMAAQRWLQLDPAALEAREIVLRMALFRGDVGEASAQATAIVRARPDNIDESLLQVARMLAQGSPAQADAAIQTMTQLADQYPDRAGASHALGIVALRYGRLELADRASKDALERAPDDRQHQLLRVGTLVRLKRLDDADRGMAEMLAQDEKPAELRMDYVKLLLDADERDHARGELDAILQDNADDADARYTLGVLDLDEKRYSDAESQFKPLLSGARADEAAFQLGRLCEIRKDQAQALDYYARIKKGNLVVDAAIRRAYVLAAMKQFDGSQALMADLREQLPMLASKLQVTEADLLAQNGALDRALVIYNKALSEQPEDGDLLYGRSTVYERQNKVDLAEADLRTMIRRDAKDARALNALGYMLTVHTRRYAEARKLIERARAVSPDDPAITDSLGWVLFKLGKKKEALTLLQAAFDKFADPEVAAHLGEALWASGDKARARTVWAQALKDAPDHQALNETIQRLSK